jgi:nucleotide-binding universal stress UspA family protein
MHQMTDIDELNKAISRVVIAADKSPVIMKASEYAARLFPDASYYIINVINTTDRAIVLSKEYENTLRKMGEESVESIKAILLREGVKKIEERIERGRPSRKILSYARNVGANLIVIATHSKMGSQAIGLGRTSRAIIEKTKIPLLIFTPFSKEREPKLILNPSSGTKYSFKASMLSVRLAHTLGAELITLYIGHEDVGKRYALVKDYAKQLGVNYTIEVAKGVPAQEILEYSKKADLMVASRGRPGVGYKFRFLSKELALGKLEKEVLGMAQIPIMLIPD